MPVPTSRRKRAARQASSDIDEEAQDTQPRHAQDDDVDDDVDNASQPAKKEKKPAVKKEKGKAPAAKEQKPQLEEDSDSDDAIDIEDFPEQPLDKADCAKIQGFAKDWASVEEVMHNPAHSIAHAAASLAEVAGEEAEDGLAELDRVMKSLLDVQAVMQGHNKVLTDLIQSIATGTPMTNAKEQYLLLVDGMNAEYDGKTTRQKYAKNDQYVDFKEAIYSVDHDGSAMPPITDFIPREDGDESDDDDDVVMGGVTQDLNCPLMRTLLKDPLTSTVCSHSFSGHALREFFGNKRGAISCPATGCNKSFTLAQCKPNPNLARKVKDHERRQARTQDDSDAEEVI
ncbi:hypothetical protein FB45DRAFT_896753, partial [Roridomyces roridus]